ncbi:hypothetical protein FHG87_007447 [Trinorchestia longiramus]|nr:hypothetical protein FHG87_007447 [Trinorchestia longiramus]
MKMSWSSVQWTAPSLGQLFLLVLVCQVLTQAVPEAEAKRFDCRLFCKETGFHAMLGGCRCSFTLFTAKRASREPYEEEGLSRIYSHLLPRYRTEQQHHLLNNQQPPSQQYYSSVKMAEGAENDSKKSQSPDKSGVDLSFPYFDELSGNPNSYAGHRVAVVNPNIHEDSPPSNKRREFEMDLDNGDPVDFLRMSY